MDIKDSIIGIEYPAGFPSLTIIPAMASKRCCWSPSAAARLLINSNTCALISALFCPSRLPIHGNNSYTVERKPYISFMRTRLLIVGIFQYPVLSAESTLQGKNSFTAQRRDPSRQLQQLHRHLTRIVLLRSLRILTRMARMRAAEESTVGSAVP